VFPISELLHHNLLDARQMQLSNIEVLLMTLCEVISVLFQLSGGRFVLVFKANDGFLQICLLRLQVRDVFLQDQLVVLFSAFRQFCVCFFKIIFDSLKICLSLDHISPCEDELG